MSSIISILSSGYGRLHLAQSADWLGKTGVNVKLVCGWVPKNPDGWLVRLCSKLVGRNLSAGMRKCSITLENGGSVLSCAWVDFLCNAMFALEGKLFHGRFHGEAAALAWKIFWLAVKTTYTEVREKWQCGLPCSLRRRTWRSDCIGEAAGHPGCRGSLNRSSCLHGEAFTA